MFKGVVGAIDFERTGLSVGTISLPYSVDRSPYYQIQLPYWRLCAGEGPSILLLGGNHGDEYEGPVALTKFLQAVTVADITGAITIFPALNAPAVSGHSRCSPFDGGNLNRTFPGNAGGTPTEQIAAFLAHAVIPQHNAVFDFHSGGTSMAHVACGLTQRLPGEVLDEATTSALKAMGLPYVFVVETDAASPTANGEAKRAGKISVGGEFGGGGSLTPQSVADTERALENVLLHLGILKRRVNSQEPAQVIDTQFVAFNRSELFVYADQAGWCEPLADIGDRVAQGQLACRMFDLLRPQVPPAEYRFAADGVILARRLHAHTQPGDCLFALGAPL